MSHTALLSKILVPLDGSERSRSAIGLAAQLMPPTAELVLGQIVPESRGIRDSIGTWRISAAEMELQLSDHASQSLAEARERTLAEFPDIAVSTEVRIGDPARSILRIADETNASMIVMTSQGRGAFGRAIVGSVADKVFRLSPRPVLIQHSSGPDRSHNDITRVVVPLDGSDLAEAALHPAIEIATARDIPLRLLSIVDPTRSSSAALAYAAAFSEQLHQELLDTAEAETRQMLETLTREHSSEGLEVSIETGSGPAARSILDHLLPGDLLVMTSHGRGGVERFLIGSTAEKLIQDGTVPVLLVPSAGVTTAGADVRP